MLTEQQNNAINLLLEGKTKSAVAKEIGVSRTTLYKWLEDKEFIAEQHRRGQKMCEEALNDVKLDVKKLLNELEKIALTSENENIRLSAINSLLDRVLGRPTSRQEVSIDKATESDIELDDIDTLLEEDTELDNVIELDKAK